MEIKKYGLYLENSKKLPYLLCEDSFHQDGGVLCSPSDIVDATCNAFHLDQRAEEHAVLLALTAKGHPLGIFELSHGVVNYSVVSNREIFIRLLLAGAEHFVVVHNHPSGDLSPSKADMDCCRDIVDAARIMRIPLMDFIIVAGGAGGRSYYSFYENGMLNGSAKKSSRGRRKGA